MPQTNAILTVPQVQNPNPPQQQQPGNTIVPNPPTTSGQGVPSGFQNFLLITAGGAMLMIAAVGLSRYEDFAKLMQGALLAAIVVILIRNESAFTGFLNKFTNSISTQIANTTSP